MSAYYYIHLPKGARMKKINPSSSETFVFSNSKISQKFFPPATVLKP